MLYLCASGAALPLPACVDFVACRLTKGSGTTSLIQSLPEDACIADCLEEFEVGSMEPGSSSSTKELGLRTKEGTPGVGTGAILGIYRGFMCSTQHFNHRWKCEPYTHWQPRLLSEFAYKMNVYAADMTRPADLHSTKGLLKDVWNNVLEVQPHTSHAC